MKYGAIIIDNRYIDNTWVHESHGKFLPEDWGIMKFTKHDVRTLNDYNNLMTSRELWEAIPFDKVLVFQQDSRLLRTGIDAFLEYDFIGAPIRNCPFPAMNGGLSLRSKEAMLKVIDSVPYNVSLHGYEDIYFCNALAKLNGKLPTLEVAQEFSCETQFKLGTLGYHAIEKYLSAEQVRQIHGQYAE